MNNLKAIYFALLKISFRTFPPLISFHLNNYWWVPLLWDINEGLEIKLSLKPSRFCRRGKSCHSENQDTLKLKGCPVRGTEVIFQTLERFGVYTDGISCMLWKVCSHCQLNTDYLLLCIQVSRWFMEANFIQSKESNQTKSKLNPNHVQKRFHSELDQNLNLKSHGCLKPGISKP